MIDFSSEAFKYLEKLNNCFSSEIIESIELLCSDLSVTWENSQNVYICGNGGSAANAIHIANDLHYGIGYCGEHPNRPGIRIEALPSNSAIITCLANDVGYENIYSNQLEGKGNYGDILIVLSGSGNSPNIIKALNTGNALNMKTHAILAYNGGKCKSIAQNSIHFAINDMQIAEDCQLIVGHMCMQWLCKNRPTTK